MRTHISFTRFGVLVNVSWRSAVPGRKIKLQPESVMADVYLGLTVAGLYTVVGMGLIIVFM